MLCNNRKDFSAPFAAGIMACASSSGGSDNAMSRISVVSTVAETVQDVDGSSYTAYKVRCCMLGAGTGSEQGACSWEVARRYSEFHELHTLLRSLGTVLMDLPSKNPFAQMMSAVRKSRELGLRDYLNAVLGHCNDEQCVLLSRFLHVNRHVRQLKDSTPHVTNKSHTMQEPAAGRPHQNPVSGVSSTERGAQIMDSADRRKRAQGAVREVVAGVPHSSLRAHTDSSAEFRSSRPPQLDSMSSSTDDELAPKSASAWQRGRPAKNQSNAIRNGAVCERGVAADMRADECNDADDVDASRHVHQQQQQHRSGNSVNAAGKAHQRGKMDGSKAGVGLFFVQSGEGGECVVDEIISGSAAQRDGTIMVGDVLRSVDGVRVGGKDLVEIRMMIVGEAGSNVLLEFSRRARIVNVLLRRSVPQPTDVGAHVAVGSPGGEHSDKSVVADTCAHASNKSSGACIGNNVIVLSGGTGNSNSSVDATHGMVLKISDATACSVGQHAEGDAGRGTPACAGGDVEERCRTLCEFVAQRDHEMSFMTGDILLVTRKHESGWWEGIHTTSAQHGWFPSNHVETLPAEPPHPSTSHSQDTQPPSTPHSQDTQTAPSQNTSSLNQVASSICAYHGGSPSPGGSASPYQGVPSSPYQASSSPSYQGVPSSPYQASSSPSYQGVSSSAYQGACAAYQGVSASPSSAYHVVSSYQSASLSLSTQQQQQQQQANKRLSSASSASVASLSRHSTVLANEASVSSSFCASSEGYAVASEAGGTPSTPDGCRLRDMGVAEVCNWLTAMDLAEYVDLFRANKIDGDMLSDLTEADLVEDFGMTNKYHRKRLLKRVSGGS